MHLETNKKDIYYNVWVKRGVMMVNTSALDPDDPDHIYNQVLNQGVDPEDYGIPNPLDLVFKDYTRADLIKEIMDLRKELQYVFQV